MILPRRKFLMGMAGLLAAPAIVRIESLMPVKLVSFIAFDDMRVMLPNDNRFRYLSNGN